MSIVLKRTPINEGCETYLDCEDERALGMDSCGCGKIIQHRAMLDFRYGSTKGLMVLFYHDPTPDCCFTAIRHDQKMNEWIPMIVEEYLAMRANDGEQRSI